MTQAIQTSNHLSPDIIEKLVLKGDLSGLNQVEKIRYYNMICERVGVDPAMQPFKLLSLQGKQVMYLDRSGAQQLNKIHQVSHAITSRDIVEAAGVYVVTARASLPDGRFTDSIGAVNISGLKGDAYGNAMMKAETKAKRRATLDLLGLGMLDETEVESIPGAKPEPITVTAEVVTPKAANGQDLSELPADIAPYYQKTNDAELAWKLIEDATDRGALNTFININMALFTSNEELKDKARAKYSQLPKVHQ